MILKPSVVVSVIFWLLVLAGLYVLQRIGSTQEGKTSFTLSGDYYNRELAGEDSRVFIWTLQSDVWPGREISDLFTDCSVEAALIDVLAQNSWNCFAPDFNQMADQGADFVPKPGIWNKLQATEVFSLVTTVIRPNTASTSCLFQLLLLCWFASRCCFLVELWSVGFMWFFIEPSEDLYSLYALDANSETSQGSWWVLDVTPETWTSFFVELILWAPKLWTCEM